MSENTPSAPTWEIEYNKRIEAFAETIGTSVDDVKKVFSGLGADGTDERSLSIIESEDALPMGDLFGVFVDSGMTKKALLRLAVPHLRGATHLGDVAEDSNGESSMLGSVVGAIKDMVESGRPVQSLKDKELLDRYEENETEVAKVLRERTHGRKCIVFNGDGSVNQEVSLVLVKAARKQPTPDKYSIDGKMVRTYRAGEFKTAPLDESPFAPDEALLNGYCAKSNTHWENASHEMRVLARIVYEVYKPAKLDMANICIDSKGASDIFRNRYPEAALIYDEREENDTLPKLKIWQGDSQKIDRGF